MILSVLIVGLILRLINLNQSLWLDEAINVLATKNYSFLSLITEYSKGDFHPPGWFIILWFWTKLFGYSEIAIRIPSVIFGVISIYVTFLIGKKLISKEVGVIAALLLCLNPLHIYYSQEARMYAMATLAVLVNIFILLKLVKGEKLNLIFLILSNMALLASDYIAYFIFPAELFLLLLKKKEIIKKWAVALIIALVLGIWWLPIFLSQLNVGSVASSNLPTWKFVVGAFDFKTLPLTFVKFIIGRISLADKVVYAAALLPICSLFALLLLRGIKRVNDFSRKLLVGWLVIPLLIATVVSFVVPVYSYFRVLYVIPAFLILISAGILSFEKRFKKTFLTLVFLIELFCSLIYLLNPSYHREDWKGLIDFLKNQDKNSKILFESSGTLPPFDYYAKGSLNANGALKNFPAKTADDVMDLQSISLNSKDVYLIDYLVEISDPLRLIDNKLIRLDYQLVETKNFGGVGFLYHYVR